MSPKPYTILCTINIHVFLYEWNCSSTVLLRTILAPVFFPRYCRNETHSFKLSIFLPFKFLFPFIFLALPRTTVALWWRGWRRRITWTSVTVTFFWRTATFAVSLLWFFLLFWTRPRSRRHPFGMTWFNVQTPKY